MEEGVVAYWINCSVEEEMSEDIYEKGVDYTNMS